MAVSPDRKPNFAFEPDPLIELLFQSPVNPKIFVVRIPHRHPMFIPNTDCGELLRFEVNIAVTNSFETIFCPRCDRKIGYMIYGIKDYILALRQHQSKILEAKRRSLISQPVI